jgi:hypothetical protein
MLVSRNHRSGVASSARTKKAKSRWRAKLAATRKFQSRFIAEGGDGAEVLSAGPALGGTAAALRCLPNGPLVVIVTIKPWSLHCGPQRRRPFGRDDSECGSEEEERFIAQRTRDGAEVLSARASPSRERRGGKNRPAPFGMTCGGGSVQGGVVKVRRSKRQGKVCGWNSRRAAKTPPCATGWWWPRRRERRPVQKKLRS